jgi:hypothetical protein
MLSAVELLGDVLLSALTLLIGSCIVGSIVAALRAVSRGSAAANMRRLQRCWVFMPQRMVSDERNSDIPYHSSSIQYSTYPRKIDRVRT